MAISRICSIDGCDKVVTVRGWCSGHYHRWQRHGDPLGGGKSLSPKGDPLKFLLEVAIPYDGPACLEWPYTATEGKSRINIGGKLLSASRMVCEKVHGPAPSPRHHAAHSCGNGHRRCVTPAHLSWKMPKDNNADKIEHGTQPFGEKHANSKLTEAQVHEIRRLRGKMSGRDIAKRFAVANSLVSAIQLRKAWTWL